MTIEYKVKDRLNKFAEELEEINDVRVDENALIQKCVTLLQNDETEKNEQLNKKAIEEFNDDDLWLV